MTLEEILKAEKKVKKWAGEHATIEVHCGIDNEPYFLVHQKTKKFYCLVRLETPNDPFGLSFVNRKDEHSFIRELFKNENGNK